MACEAYSSVSRYIIQLRKLGGISRKMAQSVD